MDSRGAEKVLKVKTITDIYWADTHCVPDPLLRVYMQYLNSHKQPYDSIIIFTRLREVK